MYFPGIFLEIESKIANINSDSFLTPANKNFILKDKQINYWKKNLRKINNSRMFLVKKKF